MFEYLLLVTYQNTIIHFVWAVIYFETLSFPYDN